MSFLRTVISIAQTALNILSPIDQFKEHWRNVNNYYRYNNVSEEGDNVAQHYLTEDLSEMLIILKKECLPDQTPTAGSATDLGDLPPGALPPSPLENMVTGPCLEFVMSSQMLDWLTKKAIMDSPRGMRCLVMDFFASFLGCIHGPLLPEAVHKPLTRLLEESKRVSPNYQPDQENENSPSAQLIISFLKLCNALARKLSRHPVLTSVLIIRTSSLGINREPSLGTLQGSPIAPTSPFRRVANGVPLVESMIVDDVANSALGLCCQVVVEHINSTGKRGQLARESLLSLISLTSVPDIHHFFRNDLMLPMRLAEVGVLLFCRLPSRLEPSPSGSPSLAAANRAGAPASDSSPQAATGSPGLGPSLPGASSSVDFMLDLASSPLRAFISYIRYLIALLESPEVSGMNIANDVVACIREQLFDLILRDTLLVQTYEERIITASLHVSELAAAVTGSVLAHPLIEALFDHVCFEGVASGSAAAPAIGPPPACTCWQHAVDLDSEAMISESQANSPEASALDFAFMSPLALAQTVFTRRLRSRNPQVAAATVRLVDQLLGMFSFCVLERLILAPPCPAARFGQCQGRANSGQRGPSNDSLAPSASVDNCPASPSSPFHLAAPDTSSNLEETLVMAGPSLQSQLWIRVVLSIFPDLLSQQTFLTEVAQHHGSLPADEHGQISHPATFSRAPGQEVPYDDYFLGVFDLEQRVRHLWADSPWVVNPLPSRLQISGVSTASGEAAPTTPVAADAPSTPSRAGPPAPLTIGLSPSGQVAATPAVSREAAEQAARLRPVGPLLPALLSLLNRAPDHSPAMLLSLTSCISRMALYPWPSVQRSIFALTGDLATALGALQEQVRASQAADPAQRLSPTQLELMLDEIAIPSSGFGLSGTGRPDEPRTLLSTLQTLGKLLSALGEQVPSLHRRVALISQGLLEGPPPDASDHTHAQYHICLVMVILSEFCKEIAATYLLLSSVHFNNHQ